MNIIAAQSFDQLYRFDEIEAAIQNLAQAANLVWLTSKDRATQSQAPRPRVDAILENLNPFGRPNHYVNDNMGARRINGWQGNFILTLATASDYNMHWGFRSRVMNFMATIDSVLGDNQRLDLLPYHSIALCRDTNNHAEITPQEGYFASKLQYEIIFSIYPQAFPGGIQNA